MIYELKDKLYHKLEEMSKAPTMSKSDIQDIHILTDTIKNLCKIEALDDGSSYGEWRADGSYAGYNRNGMHYVRGHYSHDDMSRRMDDMMSRASGEDRETLRRAMEMIRR